MRGRFEGGKERGNGRKAGKKEEKGQKGHKHPRKINLWHLLSEKLGTAYIILRKKLHDFIVH